MTEKQGELVTVCESFLSLLPCWGYLLVPVTEREIFLKNLGRDEPYALIDGATLSWHVPYRRTQILQDISAKEHTQSFHFDFDHATVPGFTVLKARLDLSAYDGMTSLACFLGSGAVLGFVVSDRCYVFSDLWYEHVTAESTRRSDITGRIKAAADRHRIGEHDPVLINLAGKLFAEDGDIIRAAQCFSHAVQLNHSFGEPFSNIGAILWVQGKFTEAFNMFCQAFVRLPMDTVIRENFIQSGMTLGCFPEMENCLLQVMRHHPQYGGTKAVNDRISQGRACQIS